MLKVQRAGHVRKKNLLHQSLIVDSRRRRAIGRTSTFPDFRNVGLCLAAYRFYAAFT